MEDLKYPIGKFVYTSPYSTEQRGQLIKEIENTPNALKQAVKGLSQDQLDTPYRPQGWTVKQVIHHVADSHINAYTRFKLASTELNPTIKPYDEKKWAELSDNSITPIEVSIQLLEALHYRWTSLLKSFTEEDFSKTFIHPDNGPYTLDKALGTYAWHGNHHIAHITTLKSRMGW